MPTFGGSSPFPLRWGGATPLVTPILNSLNRGRGTAYDTTPSSPLYVENMASARQIAAAWGTNQRVANQFDPTRTTSMLSRWEKIFGLSPAYGTSDQDRRAALTRIWGRVGANPNTTSLQDEIIAAIGGMFVAVEHQTQSTALSYWPGGTPSTTNPWYSTLMHVLVHVQKLSGQSEGDFYNSVAKLGPIMDPRLPAWVTWDWYRVDAVNNVAGFYLDSAHNLDNSIFDV